VLKRRYFRTLTRRQQSLLPSDGLDGSFLRFEEPAVYVRGLLLQPDQRLQARLARAHGFGQ
jgi:hypothetical protein